MNEKLNSDFIQFSQMKMVHFETLSQKRDNQKSKVWHMGKFYCRKSNIFVSLQNGIVDGEDETIISRDDDTQDRIEVAVHYVMTNRMKGDVCSWEADKRLHTLYFRSGATPGGVFMRDMPSVSNRPISGLDFFILWFVHVLLSDFELICQLSLR